LTISQEGKKEQHEVVLPPGTMVNDNFGLLEQFPKLEVGKEFTMSCFDPVTRTNRVAPAQVVAKENYRSGGKIIPVYVIRTVLWPLKTTAWVTADGEILQYQLLSFTFIKDYLGK
jgi:hypothetical protein